MARYAMVIDTTRCVGCNCCSLVCKIENNVPEGLWWTRAKTRGGDNETSPTGQYPDSLEMSFYTFSCQHCEKPACVEVCPTGATWKDDATGVVHQDWTRCIGCKMCMSACPYDGVRSFNEDDPTYYLDIATGDEDVPQHVANTVEKCTFCSHRLERGERPKCDDLCSYQARYFGDLDDPDSEVSLLLASRPFETLSPEFGTEPSVFYLM